MFRQRSLLLVLTASLLLLVGNQLYALFIPTYFTDNTTATSASQDLTAMESQLLSLINTASTSIDLAIYDFNRDRVRDALIAAHDRGVAVRVVTDDDARIENDTYRPYYEALENAGISIVDDGRPGDIQHNKFFIIDGQIVWSGSTNITDNGFTLNHNNSLAITSTELAAIFTTEFEQMFAGNFSRNKTASATTSLTVDGRPLEIYFSPKDDALGEIIAEVNVAQDEIFFSIFFFTSDELRDALIAAHDRGVRVQGIFDKLGASNAFSEDELLCAAGVPVFVEAFSGKNHSKFLSIDPEGSSPTLITGSMNWSASGNNDNDENTIIIHDAALAQQYATAYQTIVAAPAAGEPCVPIETEDDFFLYLPLLLTGGNGAPPVGTPSPSPSPSPTPTATPSPTPTATPKPSGSSVRIETIMYNPDGSDAEGEYVDLHNEGTTAAALTGWTLRDEADTVFTFPTFTLNGGASVRVWVRDGTNTATELFWGRGSATWNNAGDTAFLRDSSGNEVDSCTYAGGGTSATC